VLTREGRAVLVVAVLSAGAGRILGVVELFVLAVGLGTLVALAALLVLPRRFQLQVDRQVRPRTVHVGTDSRIDLDVRNDGRRSTPVLRLTDRVGRARAATLLLAPLSPGGTSTAAYRLPTDRRGIVQIGPLDVVLSDPFGLVEVRTRAATTTELTVLPPIDPVLAPPHAPGDDPLSGVHVARSISPTGREFHSLRPYVVGDDLRRVHWRSTARRGDLVVRQDEQPWQGRVTIVLDAREGSHTPDSFELAVSAAASLLTGAWERGDLVRLLTTSPEPNRRTARGNAQVETLMEDLAALQPGPDEVLGRTLEPLTRDREGGTIVLITTGLAPPGDAAALTRVVHGFGTRITVRFDPGSWGDGSAPSGPGGDPRAGHLVVVDGTQPFALAWDAAVSRLRQPHGVGTR